jgi:hypothetical protein
MYSTQFRRQFVGQADAAAPAAAAVVTPGIDVKKVATSLVTLGVLGAAAYTGIQAGRNSKNKTKAAIGYTGGIGAAIVGLAALAGLVNQPKISSTLLVPFNLPQA